MKMGFVKMKTMSLRNAKSNINYNMILEEKTQISQKRLWKNDREHIRMILTNDWYRLLAQILSCVLDVSHSFFKSEGLDPYIFPITTGSVSSPMGKGSDSLPVSVNIRGNEVYLADSMQFSLEIGTRLAKKGAYYIMPTFRGEKLDERHLNEFFHVEAELRGTLDDVMGLIKRYIVYLVHEIHSVINNELRSVIGDLSHIQSFLDHPEKHFKCIRYEDALVQLKKIDGAIAKNTTAFPNITPIGEKFLIQQYGEFTWLTHMPWENVPFYQTREEGTFYSKSADLLAGIGEIVGCGQRVYSCKDLDESLAAHEVQKEGYQWYYDMRAICPLQTSGFGLGIERFILWLTRTTDIRNCMLLIRDHDHVCLP